MGNLQSGSRITPGEFITNVTNCIADILKDQQNVLSCIREEVGEEIISDREMEEFLTMVKNRMVLVPIIGEGSSGKSTLINSLLGDIFLPFGCPKVTAMRTYIKHDPKIHSGPCRGKPCELENCPKLYAVLEVSEEDTRPLAEGASEIQEKLLEYNESASDNNRVPDMLLISANISMFEPFAESPLIHYLVDCPGLEYLKTDTEKYTTVISAVIYTHNYRRFLQNPKKIMKELIKIPCYAKVLFAVVQFDAFYEPGSGSVRNPNQDLVKRKVAETFSDKVSEEDVFPVSGKWALYSRILHKSPHNSDATFIVNQAYTMYSRKCECDVDEGKRSTVLEKSEIHGFVEGMENALKGTDHQVWTNCVKTKCEEFLSLLIDKGEKKVRMLAAEMNTMQKRATECKDHLQIIREQRQILQTSTDCNTVKEKLQEEFSVEDCMNIIKEEMKEVVQQFTEEYRDRLPIPLKEFQAGLKNLETLMFPEKVKNVLNEKANELLQVRLTNLYSVYSTLEANTMQFVMKMSAQQQAEFGHCYQEKKSVKKPSIELITATAELQEQHKSSKWKHYAIAGGVVAAGIGISFATAVTPLILGFSLSTVAGGLGWLVTTWRTGPTLSSVSQLEEVQKKLKSIVFEWKGKAYCTSTCQALSQDIAQNIVDESEILLGRYEEKWNNPLREADIQLQELLVEIDHFQKRETALDEAIKNLKDLQQKLHQIELYNV